MLHLGMVKRHVSLRLPFNLWTFLSAEAQRKEWTVSKMIRHILREKFPDKLTKEKKK